MGLITWWNWGSKIHEMLAFEKWAKKLEENYFDSTDWYAAMKTLRCYFDEALSNKKSLLQLHKKIIHRAH